MAQIGTDIDKAASLLRAGGLVSIPTETVYGLAGNALNEEAVVRIFAVKARPFFDPLIVHVASLEDAPVKEIPQQARELFDRFSPGPLTLLLPKNDLISDLVTAGSPFVAIRIPGHEMALELLKRVKVPLAAPSANPFGYISPTRASHVQDQLGDKIAYILDGGECSLGIESTIVGFEGDEPVIYRRGGITSEDLGHARVARGAVPGQVKSHYAPRKKLILGHLEDLMQQFQGASFGLLSFQREYEGIEYQEQLSKKGSLEEAAKTLFRAMRNLDRYPIDLILAEKVPSHGLGEAINDRLMRAAS